MRETIHNRDDAPKYGVQAAQSSEAIFLGPLQPKDRGKFKDREDATDMTLLAVVEYVRLNYPEGLIVEFDSVGLRGHIIVTDLLDDYDETDPSSANHISED